MRSPGRHRELSNCIAKRQNILAPQPQGCDDQREHIQPIVEILAKAPGRDIFAQPTVGGRQHAHVEGNGRASAQPLHFALLQHAQQFRLQPERHLGDLIEQQRAGLCLLELARDAPRARR